MKFKHLMPTALFLLGAWACGPQDTQHSTPDSVVSTLNKWPDPRAIPVCITNRSDISDELFNDLKQHVTNDYSSKAGICLIGWGNCTERDKSSRVIRVTFRR